MIVEFYLPRFFSPRYEQAINYAIHETSDCVNGIERAPKNLYTFKKQARIAADALSQLRIRADKTKINALENLLGRYVHGLFVQKGIPTLEDTTALLKAFDQLKKDCALRYWDIFHHLINGTVNAIVAFLGAGGILFAGLAMVSGPVGMGVAAAVIGFVAATALFLAASLVFALAVNAVRIEINQIKERQIDQVGEFVTELVKHRTEKILANTRVVLNNDQNRSNPVMSHP
ncbi:MAG: hypothetical protein WC785_01905 [Tatlockia sp.]